MTAKKKRSAKQLANDRQLGRLAKARAKKKTARKKTARKKNAAVKRGYIVFEMKPNGTVNYLTVTGDGAHSAWKKSKAGAEIFTTKAAAQRMAQKAADLLSTRNSYGAASRNVTPAAIRKFARGK